MQGTASGMKRMANGTEQRKWEEYQSQEKAYKARIQDLLAANNEELDKRRDTEAALRVALLQVDGLNAMLTKLADHIAGAAPLVWSQTTIGDYTDSAVEWEKKALDLIHQTAATSMVSDAMLQRKLAYSS